MKLLSKKGKGGNPGKNPSSDGKPLPKPPRPIAAAIPQPLAIRQIPTAEDHQQYTEEKESRSEVIRVAKKLNQITVVGIAITGIGAFVSLIGLVFVYWSFTVSREAANAAKSQSVTAATELEVSQRPWVKVEASVNGPLIFDRSGLHARFAVKGFNVGHAPAVKAFLNYRFDVRSAVINPEAEQAELCRNNPDAFGSGDVIFPSGELVSIREMNLTTSAIEHQMAVTQRTPWNPTILGSGGKVAAVDAYEPLLIGCLQYENDFSKTVHHTMFLYEASDLNIAPGNFGSFTGNFKKPFGFGNTAD